MSKHAGSSGLWCAGVVLVLAALSPAFSEEVRIPRAAGHASTGGADISATLSSQISQALGVRAFGLSGVESLPEQLPDSFAVEVEREGVSHVLHLSKGSVRGPNFQVLVQVSGGGFVEVDPGPVSTYIGYVEDEPDTLVSATLSPDGLRAVAFPNDGPGWSIEPMRAVDPSASRTEHIVYSHSDIESAGTFDGDAIGGDEAPVAAAADPTYAPYGCDVMRAELAVDADYSFYEFSGGTTNGVMANIEDVVNSLNVIYVRDCLIEYKLGKVVLRTDADTCPYYGLTGDMPFLDTLVRLWQTGQYGTSYTMAALMTMKAGGGLAYVGTACGAARYAFCGGGHDMGLLRDVTRHELGHTWGCGDLHLGCLDGPSIMCGNGVARFSADEVKTIMATRASAGCLTRIGPASAPVAPYAGGDRMTLTSATPVLVDVLANDHDANCDTLAIDGCDSMTQLGGAASVSKGTGPAGRDQLLYTSSGRTGADSFNYTIRDETGLKNTAPVSVTLTLSKRLLDYWPFNETTGTTADDLGLNGFDGALKGNLTFDTSSVQGHFGRGLSFNGSTTYVDVGKTALQLGRINGNAPRTITAWVYARRFNHGGVYEMGSDYAASQDFSLRTMNVDNKWRIQYWGIDIDFDVSSKNKWVHFAHVHDGTTTRVYANGNLVTSKACTLATGDGKNLQVGKWETYYFDGVIDDLRVYDSALDADAIRAVMTSGQAECISPADTEGNLPQRTTTLAWVPGAAAETHDVYLGTNRDSVAAATVGTPEYKGRQTQVTYAPYLDTGTQYFWRIDEVAGGAVVAKGKVWSFTTGQYAGTITREIWTGVPGLAVMDLTYWWRYPRQPNSRDELTRFEEPTDWGEEYGTRILGFLVPRVTGSYTFWIASDDQSELWLSTDASSANQVRIARMSSSVASRQWDVSAEQKSAPIKLTAGNAYYIAALHKENLWGDNLSVAWEGPGFGRQVISGLYLFPYDKDIPTPDPMTWASAPHATSSTSIAMTATTALDRSGVEYYFTCTSSSGHSSGWQSSPGYEDTGLKPGTTCSYTVKVRDKSYNQNTTGSSEPAWATTPNN